MKKWEYKFQFQIHSKGKPHQEDTGVNQDLTILEEVALEDTEDQIEVETHETIETEEEGMTKEVEIATADVADGKNCKT